jgi:hypothetical protein
MMMMREISFGYYESIRTRSNSNIVSNPWAQHYVDKVHKQPGLFR